MSNLVKKTKLTELGNKIPDISNLATKAASTTVENKISSVSNLVKKTGYNTKNSDIENKLNNHNHGKYIDTSNDRISLANQITKTDFHAKLSIFNKKITQSKTK